MFRPVAVLMAGLAIAAWEGGRVRAAGPQQASSERPSPQASYRAVLDRYCVTCHNERMRTAGLTLDTLSLSTVSADAEVWETVLRKLHSGAMPPLGRPRPEPSTISGLMSWLMTEIDSAAAARPNPGRTESLHRLNRAEYRNAIRDLLALDVDVTALLPADLATQGFDNIAEGLSISPALLDAYLSAARKLSWLALSLPPVAAVVETQHVPTGLDQDTYVSEHLPFGSRGGFTLRHYFPVDGEYEIQIGLRRQEYDYIVGLAEPHLLEARVDGERVGRFTIGGPHGTPAPLSFVGNLTGGDEWELYNLRMDEDLRIRFRTTAGSHQVGVAFAESLNVLESVVQPFQRDFRNAGIGDDAYLWNPAVDSVSIGGPYEVEGPGDSASRRRILVCRPTRPADEEPCATTIISTLARRAFRGPVAEKDIQTLLGFYRQGHAEDGFDAGIQFALERILADPRFLLRVEVDPTDRPAGSIYYLSDLELASRLSFFLWSSIPDDELLDAATRGELKDPAVLGRHTQRMLADARSKALIDNFIGQWLELRNLQDATPDRRLFPEYTDNLREAFRRETELFVESQLREDRTVLDLLASDYTFLNEQLAQHYGIPGVYGHYFRRVTFDRNSPRGGLLGHASVLTVTSYPNRTSPVLRGKWLLENVLGTPPPPPPANIPPLEDRGENDRPASVRERLEQHRENPVCATCHSQIDPLGFALENFDAVGGWRATDEGTPIDASAVMADGTQVQGPAGLRQFLLSRPERFVETVTEKLLAYALGRSLRYYDMPAVRKIVRDAEATDYRWSSLVAGIVNSTPFQMRRSRAADSVPVAATSVRP